MLQLPQVHDYAGLVLPHSPGGYQDFIHPNSKCARLVEAFYNAGSMYLTFVTLIFVLTTSSLLEPICSIGLGITALMGAKRATDGKWLFAGKHITTVCVFTL